MKAKKYSTKYLADHPPKFVHSVLKHKLLMKHICWLMFHSSHFLFLAFGHFWRQSYKNTKLLHNLYLHFARQDGQDIKENHATKVTKIPKNKRRKYGMNETNITEHFFWNTTGQENQFWVVSKISYCKAQAMKVTSSIIFVVCYAVVFLLDATTN